MGIEELDQTTGKRAEVYASLGRAEEERLGALGGVVQAVLGTVGSGGALMGNERYVGGWR